jgi:hypothetical protein
MKPKDTALEIMNKYYNLLNPNFPHINVLWKDCKECSIIAVNYIISSNPHSNPFNTEMYTTMGYWIKVKQKIIEL